MEGTTTPTAPTAETIVHSDANHPAEHSVLSKSNSANSTEKPVKISVILPTNAYFMSGIRDFTMTVVQNMTGFSEQWAFRFQSVVDELTNNAIEFGSAPGQDIKVTFVSQKGKYIEVFVEDTGTGPNKKTAKELATYVEEHKNADPTTITSIRGRGLAQIVAAWTDSLEFKENEKGGITVHVIKNLDEGEAL
ncbi:ATP-binding protein [Candidatus Peregrinibacteria bacterium]|nr:ATP-binding protein [Candidatus Peregrinibacteria bacterium]